MTTPVPSRPPDILGKYAKPVYAVLDKLIYTIAYHAKSILYSCLKRSFMNTNVSYSLRKLSSTPGVLAENLGIQYGDEKCAHQFIRSFLHMHDEQLHAAIISYM
jgi:hypothetical protein